MVNENNPKFRQLRKQSYRRQARRAPYDRILIVTEDEKSSRFYFEEICMSENLSSVNIRVLHSSTGTDPLSVVNHAKHIFNNGDLNKSIEPKSFDHIFVVFDRDNHKTYKDAIECAKKYDKRFKNDNKAQVPFKAIVSVPCFELWLLLHYDDIHAPLHRDEAFKKLKQADRFPDYEKARKDIFSKTRERLADANVRADRLIATNDLNDPSQDPYTNIGYLVSILLNLKSSQVIACSSRQRAPTSSS